MPRSDTHRTKIAAERRQPDARLKVASRLLAISDERDDRVAVAAAVNKAYRQSADNAFRRHGLRAHSTFEIR